MDREIKFRGKQLNGEWAYGDLLRIGGGCIIYIGSKTETQTPDIPKGSDVAVELFDNDIAIVIPDTVGQFTGLTDCNGKEIYEGDILGASGRIIGYVIGGVRGYCYDVVFINHSAGEKTWPLYSTVKYDYPYEITVIGNIHDNNQPTAI